MKAAGRPMRTAPVTTSSSRSPRCRHLGGLVALEPGLRLVDLLMQLAAGIVGVEAPEEVRRDLDLLLRRQVRVEHGGRALLAGRVDRRGQGGGDQRREGGERERDAGVANREQPRRVLPGSLRQKLAREGGQRQAHPGAGEQLRHDGQPCRGAREQGEAADPARDQQAARHRPDLRVAGQPRGNDRGDRQHAHREGRRQRLDAPARDEQEHDEEDHRGQRRREQRQGDRRDATGTERRPRRRRGRRRPHDSVRATCRATSRPGRTIGAWARKIARHEKACVSAPPSAGPTAIPKTDAATQSLRPVPGLPPSSRAKAATRPAAPPSAWTPRRTSSSPSEFEAPQPERGHQEEGEARRPDVGVAEADGIATRRAAAPAPGRRCRRRGRERRPRPSHRARPGSRAARA